MDSVGVNAIETAALGRPFQLGMLYDCRKDALIPGITLWDKEQLQQSVRVHPQSNTDLSVTASDSIEEKSHLLNIDGCLKLSLLSGLVSVSGAAKYLSDTKKSFKQQRLTLHYHSTTKFEALTMNHLASRNIRHYDVFSNDTATHVVTAVLYGANAYFVFDREVSSDEDKSTVEGEVKAAFEKLKGISIGAQIDLSMNENQKTAVKKFSCTFYGDFQLPSNPASFEDALRIFADLPKLLGDNKELAVPLTVWLYPLDKLHSSAAKLQKEIHTDLIRNLESVIESLNITEMKCSDLLKDTPSLAFAGFSNKIMHMKQNCSAYKLSLMEKLRSLLPKIRGDMEKETALIDLVRHHDECPFRESDLEQWIQEKEKESLTIKSLLRQLNDSGAKMEENLDEILMDLDVENVVSYTFTSFELPDVLLSKQKAFLSLSAKDNNDGNAPDLEKKTVFTPNVNDKLTMRRNLTLFQNLIKSNTCKSTTFIVASKEMKNLPGSCILLYENGSEEATCFTPPLKPSCPIIEQITSDRVVLKVSSSCPATEELRLLYKMKEEKDWKYQSVLQRPSTVTLTDLRPNTEYEISCSAVGKLNYTVEGDIIRVTTHPNKIREGRKPEFSKDMNIMKKLLKNLGLAEYYDKKLTLHTVLQINKNSVTDVPVQSLSDLPWLFLKRLMMLQRTARSIKCSSSDAAEDSEWDDDQDCPQSVNPLDILTAVFLCSDSFLQQEIILKMSMCQFAVPLLLPNSDNNQITLMLWAMRDIVKKYRPHSLSDQSAFVEERIALSELPLVSFVRLGRCNISKSEILNKLLSSPQQYTDTFVHFNMDCGNISKTISDGLVEMVWYLPCGNKNIDVFPEAVAIANLRGDIQSFETQYAFLCEASTAVFVFFESQLLDSHFISVPSQKSMPELFFVGDSNNESIKATVSKLKLKKSNFIFKAKQNDADFVDKIQSKLQDAIKNNNNKMSVVHLAEIARNLEILVDEDAEECQRAKASADEITSKMNDIVQFKKKELSLQGEILMKLAKIEKEECRLNKVGDKSVEDYKSDLQIEKTKLREQQYRTDMSATMSCFISAISSPEKAYFLKWLRINLENRSHEVLPQLRELYKQKCQDVCGNETEITELDKKISNSSLGVEHFIREMSQLYEAAVSLSEDALYQKQLGHLPKLCAELLLDGFSLELVDGDCSNIPEKWLSSVFSELNTLVEPKNKIMVVTVLGVQSSGKSTLLNTMFGVQFAVSSGRCTRGAFMQLIKVTEECKAELNCDYIVIIDTEGLKSPELAQLDNSYEHDNELATLVVGLSDVTIVNIAMENSTEMKDILQIIVHAFLRMREIGKKQTCLFVHQNVADVSAHDSNMRDRKFLLEQLNEMTQAAAKMENKLEFNKFTDVMNYDTVTGDHYIPGLWHGNPPMAPVSIGYSESVYALKKHVIEIFRGYKSSDMNEFIRWTKDLWTAVKFEKFIFSFRNSLVADAYMKLCTEYNTWDWTLRKQMHTWALEAETNILNYGKFENSEECNIEDFCCHLLQKAAVELSIGEEDIFNKIKSYYEQGEDHVELVESYRQDFINSANSLKKELSNSITCKLNAALSRRNAMMKVEGIQKTYMDTMEKKVLDLLKVCRENKSDMSDSMLDEAFEKMWQETVSTLSYTGLQKQDITTRVLLHLRKNLISRGSSVAQHLDEVKDLNMYGQETFIACKNKNRFSKWYYKSQTKIAQETSDNLIRECWEFVEAKRESKDDYDDTYIREILNMIDETLKAHEDLKEDVELPLKLHICGFASREFQKIHNQFIQKNNPQTALENFKETYRCNFIDLYLERDQCQKTADEFMSNCIKPALEKYMSDVLGMKMADEMKTGENSKIFGTRTSFQIFVLKNLLESKFETYLLFIKSYETFVKAFIFEKVREHFTAENRMFKLEETLLNEVFIEITHAIEEAEQDSTINDIKGFIQLICRKLQERLVIPRDVVDKISTLNNANPQKIAECLHCSVKDMDKSLKASLKKSGFESRIKHLQTKPQDMLFKRVQGCRKQCPFCKAPCEAGGEDHSKHFVSIHRPQGLGCYRFHHSKKLVTDICTSLVHSDSRFKCRDTKDEWHPYKEYDKIYPDWHIDREPNIEPSAYWIYVMAQFNDRFAKEYDAKPADIPSSWNDITKIQADKSLK